MSRTFKRLLIGLGVAAALSAALWFTPMPYYIITPGLTLNLDRIVHVAHGTPPKRGKLMMVAVGMQPANLFYYLYGRVSPYGELIPNRDVIPPGGTPKDYQKQSQQEMVSSHSDAKVAALRYLGYPARAEGDGVKVYADLNGEPADSVLKKGDVIVSIDQHKVTLDTQLLSYMKTVTPGQKVHLVVLRSGKTLNLTVGTAPDPSNPKQALMGVAVGTDNLHYKIPVKISIDTGQISGPSAGMMFAVEIIAQLRPQWNLTHGLPIAGTGLVTPDGKVGQIGGVMEKLATVYHAGAKIFFVPKPNYKAAHQQLIRLHLQNKIKIIPVATLAQVVHDLKSANPGA